MNISEKTEEIVRNVRLINKIIHMKRHEIAQGNNLTLDQFHTLIYLKNTANPPTIGEMAVETKKAQNTISERISRLEEKGYVERIKDKNDRRVSRVILTGAGAELINSINYQASNELIRKALIDIEADVVDKMLYGLDELAKRLEEK
ncbi:MarR family transcriptional regulator [Proteiniborus sp. MB09-C3]|uniref:MarR family winged helix-turn-helix transcriptional regulator n=1 Tax=Proteiniborus sp. MB09-C3 TaxID=3050072 RepID=UPI002555673E|nr:MarR family transcriptional regulator [Proteiniborus sp. MB09-C3]WIV11599.1 MarR family transcriptional regulator [Proteiniborus sp. MB09-C3]